MRATTVREGGQGIPQVETAIDAQPLRLQGLGQQGDHLLAIHREFHIFRHHINPP
jgi:hypothetical protein